MSQNKNIVYIAVVALIAVVTIIVSLAAAIPAISDLQRAGDVSADRERFLSDSGSASGEEDRQARAYNDRIAGYESDFEIAPYEDQLTLAGNSSMMAWLDVPSVGISLPICRGASRGGDIGAGHLADSALPLAR